MSTFKEQFIEHRRFNGEYMVSYIMENMPNITGDDEWIWEAVEYNVRSVFNSMRLWKFDSSNEFQGSLEEFYPDYYRWGHAEAEVDAVQTVCFDAWVEAVTFFDQEIFVED